jgi:hypothetical protein
LFIKKSSTGNGGVSLLSMFLSKNDEDDNFEVFHRNSKNCEGIPTYHASYPSIFTLALLLHNSVNAM